MITQQHAGKEMMAGIMHLFSQPKLDLYTKDHSEISIQTDGVMLNLVKS